MTNKINYSSVKNVGYEERPEVVQLSGIQKAGLSLSYFVLWIISGFTIAMLCYIFISESNLNSLTNDVVSNKDSNDQVFAYLDEIRDDSRKFALDIAQHFLINAFLPVLTALLGYIFGTTTASSNSDS